MWSPENDHVFRLFATDRVNVLVDGIGRAHIPVSARSLHRRHQLKELPQLLRHNTRPPFADVPVQRKCLVLSKDIDLRSPELMQLESVMSMIR